MRKGLAAQVETVNTIAVNQHRVVSFSSAKCKFARTSQELDSAVFANYRPVSNLHTILNIISNIIKQILLPKITAHVKSSSSYDCFKSAYRHSYSEFKLKS